MDFYSKSMGHRTETQIITKQLLKILTQIITKNVTENVDPDYHKTVTENT